MSEFDHGAAARAVGELESGFGLRWVAHRIGALDLRFAEVAEVDRCVHSLYPQCLVDHGDAPVWMIGWPAAFALAEHLVHEVGVQGQRLIELGCGTAVVGVAAAAAGARVLSTDYDDYALAVAWHNGRVNRCADFTLGRLDWYEPRLERRYELVAGSEITYHEVAFEPLLGVLTRAVAPDGRVVLSDIFRRQTDTFLERAADAGWQVDTVRRFVHLEAASQAVRIATLRPPTSA